MRAAYEGAGEEASAVLEEFSGEMEDIFDALQEPKLTVEQAAHLQSRVMVLYDAIGEVRTHLANYLSIRVLHATCFGGDPAGEILSAIMRVDKSGNN